jgi:hypothetical protein
MTGGLKSAAAATEGRQVFKPTIGALPPREALIEITTLQNFYADWCRKLLQT